MLGYGKRHTFDQAAFFAQIATDLHERGVLKTYDKPLGRERPKWNQYVKKSHASGRGKNKPGLVQHVGDEPYSELTTAQVQAYRDIDPDAEDLKLKSASVIKAIRAYMPEDKFAEYLAFFTANLKKPSHRAALQIAYNNISEQLAFDDERKTLNDMEKIIQDGKPNLIREALPQSTIAFELVEKPELMLTLAIYQAAHMTYVDQLRAAIKDHKEITPDERDNANAVLDGPFKQFRMSNIFSGIAPFIMMERVHLGEATAGQSEDAMMKQAIAGGWTRFFESKVLTREYKPNEIPPAKDGDPAKLVCPAINHLKGSQQAGSLEKIYDYVAEHRKELKKELKEVKQATTGAVGVASQQGWANFHY